MTTLDGGVIIKKGGGVPINNQDKSVDITENGTTEVVADSEFTGLGKVTINTKVDATQSSDWICYLVNEDASELQRYRSIAESLANKTTSNGLILNLKKISGKGNVLSKKDTTVSYSGDFMGQAIPKGCNVNTFNGTFVINSYNDAMNAIASFLGASLDVIKECFKESSIDNILKTL